MTLPDGVFRFLSLCGQRPGSAAVAQRLPSVLAAVPSFDELATAAEQHGMEPLVSAVLRHVRTPMVSASLFQGAI